MKITERTERTGFFKSTRKKKNENKKTLQNFIKVKKNLLVLLVERLNNK